MAEFVFQEHNKVQYKEEYHHLAHPITVLPYPGTERKTLRSATLFPISQLLKALRKFTGIWELCSRTTSNFCDDGSVGGGRRLVVENGEKARPALVRLGISSEL